MMLWYLQYLKTGSSSSDEGGIRIARSNTQEELINNSWTSYVLDPDFFGLGLGKWLDFPDMEVTNGFAYFTSNVFTTTSNSYTESVLWRIDLGQLEAGSTINVSWITSSDGTIGLTTNATSTMYAATVTGSTSLKVYTWPDSGGVTTNNVSGLATTTFGTHNSLDNNGFNWTGRADSRVQTGWVAGNEIGFMWNSAENGGSRPKPFVRAVVLNAGTKAIVRQPDIWNSTVTWHYPAISSNARGDLAGTIGYNGANGPVGTQILIDDDFTTGWAAQFGSLGSDGPMQNRWGDYLDARPDDNFPNTWIASGFHHNGTTTTTDFFWFGRERDNPTGPLPLTTTSAEGYAYTYNDSTGNIVDDTLSFDAFINFNGDVDSYFFGAQTTGTYVIDVGDFGNAVDPIAAIYNASTGAFLGGRR